MGKHKSGKKKKGSQFAIRVDKDERDAFVALCESMDTSAAREIRRFMREWVATHTPASAVVSEAAPPEAIEIKDPAVEPALPVDAAQSSDPQESETVPEGKPVKSRSRKQERG